MSKVVIENPWPLIFKSQFDFKFDDFKLKVIDHLREAKEYTEETNRVTPEFGGTTSVVLLNKGPQYRPPHLWPEFQPFTGWLQEFAEHVWQAWDYEKQTKKMIGESWINEHPPGSYTGEHHHHGSHMAVAAYLDVPENSGRLLLKNPMHMYLHGLPMSHTTRIDGKYLSPIEVKTNDVLIFPAWIDHMTEVNQSDSDRYVMSLNIKGFY